MRPRFEHIGWASLGLALALAWPAGGQAQAVPAPAPPRPETAPLRESPSPGARLLARPELLALESSNDVFAVIFFLDNDKNNGTYCQIFNHIFDDSLLDAPAMHYTKIVYFPKRSLFQHNRPDCGSVEDVYEPEAETDLGLKRLLPGGLPDRGATIMLMKGSPAGVPINMGYIQIYSYNEQTIKQQITLFNDYYRQGKACWEERKNINIDESGQGPFEFITSTFKKIVSSCN